MWQLWWLYILISTPCLRDVQVSCIALLWFRSNSSHVTVMWPQLTFSISCTSTWFFTSPSHRCVLYLIQREGEEGEGGIGREREGEGGRGREREGEGGRGREREGEEGRGREEGRRGRRREREGVREGEGRREREKREREGVREGEGERGKKREGEGGSKGVREGKSDGTKGGNGVSDWVNEREWVNCKCLLPPPPPSLSFLPPSFPPSPTLPPPLPPSLFLSSSLSHWFLNSCIKLTFFLCSRSILCVVFTSLAGSTAPSTSTDGIPRTPSSCRGHVIIRGVTQWGHVIIEWATKWGHMIIKGGHAMGSCDHNGSRDYRRITQWGHVIIGSHDGVMWS